jgi:hypothetical protein
MTHDHASLGPKSLHEPDDVARQVEQRVLTSILWGVSLPVATLVRCNGVVPSGRKRSKLMPVRMPRFWEPMTKHNERTFAFLCDVHTNAIRINEPVRNTHRFTSLASTWIYGRAV